MLSSKETFRNVDMMPKFLCLLYTPCICVADQYWHVCKANACIFMLYINFNMYSSICELQFINLFDVHADICMCVTHHDVCIR